MQKSARKWSKNTFLHFLALWPIDFAQFSPPMCAIWYYNHVGKSLCSQISELA